MASEAAKIQSHFHCSRQHRYIGPLPSCLLIAGYCPYIAKSAPYCLYRWEWGRMDIGGLSSNGEISKFESTKELMTNLVMITPLVRLGISLGLCLAENMSDMLPLPYIFRPYIVCRLMLTPPRSFRPVVLHPPDFLSLIGWEDNCTFVAKYYTCVNKGRKVLNFSRRRKIWNLTGLNLEKSSSHIFETSLSLNWSMKP